MNKSYNEKIIIIFGFLVVLIYIYKYFDFDKFINGLVLINSNKEDFYNPFKPNKIFKYKDKIYLLDTRNILEKDVNPKKFNTFEEYKKFILKLEKDYSKQLDTKIKKNTDIKSLDLKPNLKLNLDNSEELEPYYKNKKCNNLSAKLSYGEEGPFVKDINKTKNNLLNDNNNNSSILSENDYKKLNNILKNNILKNKKDLIVKCEELKRKEETIPKECELFNSYLYNENILKEIDFLINQKKNIDGYNKLCLLEDTFRENMLEFDF